MLSYMEDFQPADDEDMSIFHFRHGDPEAFKVIFISYYGEFLSFGHMLLQRMSLARIVATDAFLFLWSRRADFNTEKKIKTFLYIAIRNSCLRILQDPSPALPDLQQAIEDCTLPPDLIRELLAYTEKA